MGCDLVLYVYADNDNAVDQIDSYEIANLNENDTEYLLDATQGICNEPTLIDDPLIARFKAEKVHSLSLFSFLERHKGKWVQMIIG